MFASYFDTPFGKIDLSLLASPNSGRTEASPARRALRGAELVSWSAAHVDADLLLLALQPELPAGLAVTHCHAAVWRVRAHTSVDACTFEARWARTASPPDGGPSSGQFLNALTWSDDLTELSLGAPDAEGLVSYERAGIGLPAAWAGLLSVDDPASVSIEDYLSDGLRLRLPGLQPHESATIHFAVAWADAAANEDAPWFAVDIGPPVIRSCLDRMSNER
jgi:hypothetical protein